MAQRSDVRRNREALLAAANDLLAVDANTPMYEVAKRAQVGQATLYRHFPDRITLAAALAARRIDELEADSRAEAGRPDALLRLVRDIVEASVTSGGLFALLHGSSAGHERLVQLRSRLVEMIRPALQNAKRSGDVRADLTANDVFLLIRMAGSALIAMRDEVDHPRLSALIRRSVELLWSGAARRTP